MALFALVIVAYLGAALLLPVESERWTRLREVMAVVLPAVTGTLGIALGFYFGSQTKQGSE